jgi:hypothetical protein
MANKLIKILNSLYTKLQLSLNTALKTMNSKKYEIKTTEEVELFKKQMEEHYILYETRDPELFEKVDLIKQILQGKPSLNQKNTNVVWSYINTIYTAVTREKKDNVAENGLEKVIQGFASENSTFKGLVGEIMEDLKEYKLNERTDSEQLVKDLLSGNLQSTGIDFKSIIDKSVKKLNSKIESGEIDKDEITKTSEKFSSLLNVKK